MTYYLKVLLQKFQTMKTTLLSLHPKLTAIYKIFIHSTSQIIVCLFYLNLYVPSIIFQLNRDGSSWVEPVLS